jgi:hypothetical protein
MAITGVSLRVKRVRDMEAGDRLRIRGGPCIRMDKRQHITRAPGEL